MSRVDRRLARHYAEMVAVMFAGMLALGVPAGAALRAAGTDWSTLGADAMLGGMAVTMTVPMVAWMAWRGHSVRANGEMAASMIVPTLATVALFWTGLIVDVGALMVIEHVAMLAGMAGVMLWHPHEYTRCHARVAA